MRSALKAFRDLQRIELNRVGLARVLEVTPLLYQMKSETMTEFFRGVLTQIIDLCRLGHSGFISTIDGVVLTQEGEEIRMQAGIGEFDPLDPGQARIHDVIELCKHTVFGNEPPSGLRADAMIAPLRVGQNILGFVYLESATRLTDADRELIQILADQCASALENMRLNVSLQESYEHVLEMLAGVAEFKDKATGAHIRRISEYTRRIAGELGYDPETSEAWGKASRLHDVGKVGIPDAILGKPGRLNEAEYEVIKTHSAMGAAILNHDPSLALARTIALYHHERWDGQGYPEGLAGEAIPLPARITSVADVLDALISPRPYKEPWPLDEAVAEIRRESGTRYDPQVVEALLAIHHRGDLAALLAESGLSGTPRP